MGGPPPRTDPMVGEVRFRVPLPVLIPIAAVVAIALITIGFSRVLLAIPKEAAVVVALVTAVNILGACAVLAYRPQANLAELAAIVLYPVIIGIAIAQFGIGEEEASHSAGETQAQAGGGGGGGGLTVTAQGVQFNTKQLELPANKPATITFDNQDSVQHNIAIYESQQAKKELFKGKIIAGGESTQYDVPGLPKGNYAFICDVHPTSMTGKVLVQ